MNEIIPVDVGQIEDMISNIDKISEIWLGQLPDEPELRKETIQLLAHVGSLEGEGKMPVADKQEMLVLSKNMLDTFTEFQKLIETSQDTLRSLLTLKIQ